MVPSEQLGRCKRHLFILESNSRCGPGHRECETADKAFVGPFTATIPVVLVYDIICQGKGCSQGIFFGEMISEQQVCHAVVSAARVTQGVGPPDFATAFSLAS